MAKRKLTALEKSDRNGRRLEFRTIFIDRKQKNIRRPATMEDLSVDEFIRRNADPIWSHQNEIWELMDTAAPSETETPGAK